MQRRMILKSEIHRARTTEGDLHLPCSVTLDPELMKAADICEYEQVTVVNAGNGARLETYALAGEPGSGEVRLDGAAARLAAPGTLITLLSYETLMTIELGACRPRIVNLDGDNQPAAVDERYVRTAIR